MKNLIHLSICIILMIAANTVSAQQAESQNSVTNVLKLNFFLPGISYEQKIATHSTLYLSTYLDALVSYSSENSFDPGYFFLMPALNTEFRNYFSLHKRERKGLRSAMNSANYIAPLYIGRYSKTDYYSESEWINRVGAVWGMQRNAPKGFSLDLRLGLAYTFNANHYYFYDPIEAVIQIDLGFWLGSRSR
jgi:hypothetical protein